MAAIFHNFQPKFSMIISTLLCFTNFVSPARGLSCLQDQKTLLLEFKNNFVFDSSISRKLVLWEQTNDDCCDWDGVGCDAEGHVIGLQLDDEGIIGGLNGSSSIFSLKFLEKLNLAFNDFNGTQIPIGVQNLKHLTHLNLSNAGFSGHVPLQLSTMKSLVSLDLSSYFPGFVPLKLEIPNLTIIARNLSALTELYLDSVEISARGNEWGPALASSLPNLKKLSLRDCGLSGPLHRSLSQLRFISVLRLDMNNLSTIVPHFFANFTRLRILGLVACSLQGHFPQEIFHIPTLEDIYLSDNEMLSGTIPQFPQTRPYMKTIILGYTNFSGSLPDSISNLSMLSTLDITNASFIGSIPSTLADLTELVYLDFSYNFFTDSIPLFRKSKNLVYLDFTHNSLTGSLSSKNFEALSNLEEVHLAYNSLNGSIPLSLFSLRSLKYLRLASNKFSGQVPEFPIHDYSSNMKILDLSNNLLDGPIPGFFFQIESLNVLLLSSNYFNGTIQVGNIARLQNLTRLDLSHNNLSLDEESGGDLSWSNLPQLSTLFLASCSLDSFPDLRHQSMMGYLDLSNNRISGEIPSWIWEIGNGSLVHLNLSYNFLMDLQKPYYIPTSLIVLDLRSNQLRGVLPLPSPFVVYLDYANNNFGNTIPSDIGAFISFTAYFSLANNTLIGPIPISICNATHLLVLELSSNNLTGGIPPCLVENTAYLGVLDVSRNNLSGDIPDTFPVDCSLQTLDLSWNNFDGNIPYSLENCKSLEVMNVGRNNINDSFPCMLSSTLRVLVLRSNKFYGSLDSCPESLPNLQIIDISSNNFSGYLDPRWFSSRRAMMLHNGSSFKGEHLHFPFLKLNDFYFQDSVTVTGKGQQLELVKIFTIFTVMDFSCNNFEGDIPDEVGDLIALYVLNLSHNALMGTIPKSIGNLTELGSLDLSWNQLSGRIPKEMAELTFLSFLNLSYNKLVGMIPNGPQFQTFTVRSFQGNTDLWGFPLDKSCSTIKVNDSSVTKKLEREVEWAYVSSALGFVVGLAGFLWPLFYCQSWSEMYFEKVEGVFLKLFCIQEKKRTAGRRVLPNHGGE